MRHPPPPSLPEVHDHLLSLADLEREAVALASCCQVPDLLSVGSLIIAGDETQDGGVIHQFKDGVGAVCVYTVMHLQGIQEWTEYAALWGSGAQGQYRGGETAHSHVKKSNIHLQRECMWEGMFNPRLLSLMGTIVLNAEL